MGKLDGKVVFITGAGRGQGRSHAVRLAQEGADIIAVDIAADIETVAYPLSTPEDLKETARMIEALDRRIVARQADVRDRAALEDVLNEGIAELGPVDIVIPNAGIIQHGTVGFSDQELFRDVIDVNLVGVWNTVSLAAPAMVERGAGGSIVFTSSTQGVSGRGGDGTASGTGYSASKHAVVGLMRNYANWLSPHGIRVNAIVPTGVATGMIMNDALGRWMAANPAGVASAANLMPIGMVDPIDISNAVLFLVSDEGRYITGITLPVDAGFSVK